jgi:DNA topoisomerase-1
VGDLLDLQKLDSKQHFTQPPPLFTEASLIKELEEGGIGRPSTYVPIISTIQDRGYVEQQDRRFVPTWLGVTVNDLMVKHFPDIVDVNFTADMERRLDDVEEGKREWTAFLNDFYEQLRTMLSVAEKEMDKVQKPTEELGENCPECGRPLLIRMGRFGRFVSCSGFNAADNPCTYKRSLVNKTGAICPQCGGDLVERKSRGRGKIFYGCANYPTCSFAVWNRPLPIPCPEDHGLLTQANGAKEAICYSCGAIIDGIAENQPVVIGHREVAEINQPKRSRPSDGDVKPERAVRTRRGTTATAGRAKTTSSRTRGMSTRTATVATRTTTRTRSNGTEAGPARKPTSGRSTKKRNTTTSEPRPVVTGAEV